MHVGARVGGRARQGRPGTVVPRALARRSTAIAIVALMLAMGLAMPFAAAAVMRHKLSLGGFENLSLGVKLLTQSAMLASMSRQGGAVAATGAPASATGAAAPAAVRAVAPPPILAFTSTPVTLAFAMGAGLLAFHELSYHRFSVQYGTFHPVHMHFFYG